MLTIETVSPVVVNSETQTLHDTCDTLNQDSDVTNNTAYRRVSPIVKNCETKMLNNTYSNPVSTNQNAKIANDARPQLHSKTSLEQTLDFYSKSTHPKSRSDDTKRSKMNISRDKEPWFTRLKQRKSTTKSKKLSRTHKTMSTKIRKWQTKESVHQTFTTSNFISPSNMLPFLSRLLLKRPKVKVKHK